VSFATPIAVFTCLGAYIGSLTLLAIPEGITRLTVALFLILGSYFTLGGVDAKKPFLSGVVAQLIVGLAFGFYIAILGEASTLVTIAALGFFFRLDILRANATAKLLIFFTNLIAFLGYASGGAVNYPSVLSCSFRWRSARGSARERP